MNKNRQQNVATTRILQILSLFAFNKPTYGVTELSDEFGITKNMAYRALNSLLNQGYLVRSGTKYELGYNILTLLNYNFPEPRFRTISWPYIEQLHELTKETVFLSSCTGDRQVIIDGIEGQGKIVAGVQVGLSLPLHVSTASWAILSSMSDNAIKDYLKENKPLKQYTNTTIIDKAEIWRKIESVRAAGYSSGIEDFRKGANTISFAIPAADRRPHGALSIAGPKTRFTKDTIKSLLPEIEQIINNLRKWAILYPATIVEM